MSKRARVHMPWSRYRRGRGCSRRRWRALQFRTLVNVAMDCGALAAQLRREDGLRRLELEEATWKPAGVFLPGDRVMLTGRALHGMGALASDVGAQRWTVVACGCDLCELGRHVFVDAGRHVAAAALRHAGQPCVDELRPEDTDAQAAQLGQGLRKGYRRMGA